MSTVTADDVSEAINPLRIGFQADGADLVVDSADDNSAVVRLVLTEQTCMECIVSYDMLKFIISGEVTKHFPQISEVDVIDPRRGWSPTSSPSASGGLAPH